MDNRRSQIRRERYQLYRDALIQLGVDVSGLSLDKPTHAPAQMSQDEEVQAGVRALAEWQDAYKIIEAVTGEPPAIDEDGQTTPTVAQMYKAAALKMGAEIPEDTDPAAYKFIFQAMAKNGGGRRGDGVASMAADSAAVASFSQRYPHSAPSRRLF